MGAKKFVGKVFVGRSRKRTEGLGRHTQRREPRWSVMNDGSGEASNRPYCGAFLRVNAVRKAEAWEQGKCFLPLSSG
jgi:hypothetical protein